MFFINICVNVDKCYLFICLQRANPPQSLLSFVPLVINGHNHPPVVLQAFTSGWILGHYLLIPQLCGTAYPRNPSNIFARAQLVYYEYIQSIRLILIQTINCDNWCLCCHDYTVTVFFSAYKKLTLCDSTSSMFCLVCLVLCTRKKSNFQKKLPFLKNKQPFSKKTPI